MPSESRRAFLATCLALGTLAVAPWSAAARKPPEADPFEGLPRVAPTGLLSMAWFPRQLKDDPYPTFAAALGRATDFAWLKPGDRVLIKLSLNSGKPYPASSDPWCLEMLIRLLGEKGAGRVLVGDQSGVEYVLHQRDRTRGSSRDLCRSAGILDVIERSGAEPIFFEEAGYDAYRSGLPEGPIPTRWPAPIWFTRAVEEVDHIVYLPRIAAHAIGDCTLGYKIAVGFLREDSRRLFHSAGPDLYALYQEISDLGPIASRLRLVVSSGRAVLATIGPDMGHVVRPRSGPVFASTDLLAHEIVALSWLRHVQERGLPIGQRSIDGLVAANRSAIHASWMKKMWGQPTTPDVPTFHRGDPWLHPAVRNALARRGGVPSAIPGFSVNGPERFEDALDLMTRARLLTAA